MPKAKALVGVMQPSTPFQDRNLVDRCEHPFMWLWLCDAANETWGKFSFFLFASQKQQQ
jgi:hypothetical protein